MHVNPIWALRLGAGMTQAELAGAAGTSQPTIAAYEGGSKSPTLRTLERLARAAGVESIIDFVPPLTREDRRSLALHAAIAEKLVAAPGVVIARAERNLTRMRRVNPHASRLLEEWERVLESPVPQIVGVLLDSRPRARDLRQVTPFAGVLDRAERAAVYRSFREQDAA